eukprot:scaffold8828_cov129-Isochrysis_galbana.AAC.3
MGSRRSTMLEGRGEEAPIIADSPNWEGTGKIFCLRADLRQNFRRFQGVRLLGFFLGACGRHAVYHLYAHWEDDRSGIF